MLYQPTLSSIQQHPLPSWYEEAKFGIFVHWTISSVPAYAPTGLGDIGQIFARKSQAYTYTHQPYAEWYLNSLRIEGSPVYEYHRNKYGANYPYEAFAQTFNEESQKWDPDQWADLFEQAGARYVVLVTKHHDGFLLWDSQTPNPFMPDYRTTRDVTGELSRSIKARGLKMGLYYSSALDWTFTTQPILGFGDLLSSGPTSREYLRYVEEHWKELIDRYDPDILTSDIAYPPHGNLPELFAYFYNHNAEGVVNDRWFQLPTYYFNSLGKFFFKWYAKRLMQGGGTALPSVPHCDFRTTEYNSLDVKAPFKWESTRGIGNSFTYNQFETAEDYLKAPELIRMLVEVVSRNGNLLLNVGPRPDGSIPEAQVEALQGIGRWLAGNGEAIYGTHPWKRATDANEEGLTAAYTVKENYLYIFLLQTAAGMLRLHDIPAREGGNLILLGEKRNIAWRKEANDVFISLPDDLDWTTIPVLRMELAQGS